MERLRAYEGSYPLITITDKRNFINFSSHGNNGSLESVPTPWSFTYGICAADALWLNEKERAAASLFKSYLVTKLSSSRPDQLGFQEPRQIEEFESMSAEEIQAGLTPPPNRARQNITVLVLDASGSMEGARLNAAKTSIKNYAAEVVRRRIGPLALLSFSAETKLEIEPTTELSEFTSKVGPIVARGGGPLYEAVGKGVALVSDPRYADYDKHVIVITDGPDRGSRITESAFKPSISDAVVKDNIILDVLLVDSDDREISSTESVLEAAGADVMRTTSMELDTAMTRLLNGAP